MKPDDAAMLDALTRRQTLAAALAAAALPGISFAQGTKPVLEMTMGDADAPVKLIEYAMFTCPHCAAFNKDVFPKIKANYIDTGKVQLTFREVYFNAPSLWAAVIARCAPPDRYFGIVDLLFSTQAGWLNSSDGPTIMKNLYGVGRQAGLTDAQMDACRNDQAFAEALVAAYQKNATADAIDATPTFLINGAKLENVTYEEFEAKLNAALGL
jgi:protein-disulfide isomerase